MHSMLKIMDIEDDKSDIINKLKKIELQVNYLCEARNFLLEKDRRTNPMSKGLESFENDIDTVRRRQTILDNI